MGHRVCVDGAQGVWSRSGCRLFGALRWSLAMLGLPIGVSPLPPTLSLPGRCSAASGAGCTCAPACSKKLQSLGCAGSAALTPAAGLHVHLAVADAPCLCRTAPRHTRMRSWQHPPHADAQLAAADGKACRLEGLVCCHDAVVAGGLPSSSTSWSILTRSCGSVPPSSLGTALMKPLNVVYLMEVAAWGRGGHTRCSRVGCSRVGCCLLPFHSLLVVARCQ